MEQVNKILEMPARPGTSHGPNETNESPGKTSRPSQSARSLTTRTEASLNKEKRTQAVRLLILKARAACQQDAIDVHGAQMATIVAAWEEALALVPTEYLNPCYLFALRNHDSSFPIGVGEIANVWEKNGEAWLEDAGKDVCPF